MTDDQRIGDLEQEVRRLKQLLNANGSPGTLRHQTRNALALVRAVMRRTAETASSVEDFAAHLDGRLDALLRAQTLLIMNADRGADLQTLIGDELVAHTIRDGERASVQGPVVSLPPKTAELLTLAIHELVVNAIKFGAMAVPDGRIAISWSVGDDARRTLHLIWEESGLTGLRPSPAFRGFGIETLENMLPYQAEAESRLDFRPTGLHCMIDLPLESIR